MKKIIRTLFFSLTCIIWAGCGTRGESENTGKNKHILKVPSDFTSIRDAVQKAVSGDVIVLAPGTYFEHDITIDKAITITSGWKTTGDESIIEQTIIDSQDSILFNIDADSIEISGLKIINGDHPLNISANVKIMHNHFIGTLDAMSFEGSGGGYAGYNTVENDRDDGIDLDIRKGGENLGTDIVVEHNTIINSHDDGIEIRLYDYPDQNIKYTIRENRISSSNNAGIQIISYDIFTGKTFRIHHNIISGCKTGVGCMEGSNSSEDMSGATKMDELVCLYNNTLIGNQTGATGGNNMVAFNNLVLNNSAGGFKRFGQQSVIRNNLLFNNGGADFVELNESAIKEGNILLKDPLINQTTFKPLSNSPCINAGLSAITGAGNVTIEVSSGYISGQAPDIGAIEFN